MDHVHDVALSVPDCTGARQCQATITTATIILRLYNTTDVILCSTRPSKKVLSTLALENPASDRFGSHGTDL